MKFTNAISTALIIIPSAVNVAANLDRRQDDSKGKGGNAGGNANDNSDPQKSLTLDPKVIASGFANDGQDQPTEGQVPSLTSTNNFINFCLLSPNLPITNGQQITSGSCNPAPIGLIPSVDKMPSAKFTNPKNGDTVAASKPFTISVVIKNLQTGSFVNANKNYFAAPQQLNGGGIIVGHSHVVIDPLSSLSQTTPTDPQKFIFFKGLNAVAQNGVLTADVTSGVPPGAYRLCSINTSSNHQPAIVPVAQHGFLDDCIYFSATPDGAPAAGSGNGGGADGANAGAGKDGNAAGGNGADNGAGAGAGKGGAGDAAGADAGAGKDGAGGNAGKDGAGGDASNGAGKDAGNGAPKGAGNDGNAADNGANKDAGAGSANGGNAGDSGAANGADSNGGTANADLSASVANADPSAGAADGGANGKGEAGRGRGKHNKQRKAGRALP
ncbi:hypothetical protein D9613_002000 [Agrocybe pediades]|uniref:Uncharacterized protein n=1 Tax=Agrocybe pediades TaxID=84607 RepID=A0A8H4R5E7_9AGAR|nr:hypothetical protein D9613_002000 [Agrocybe pediades]